ncbi:uncharacterized protein LOC122061401 isoform X2 [Macadamia integrifolia]|uniref:uncharacterized protein LOC122061401 isoform X2 n=1 Tax=Macadamia integrifolia TaxID=60698 RepID=UPI001C53371D|nr:uncharacterized protein LOC122061401 isoform X2 [Macadamia integrifolia]
MEAQNPSPGHTTEHEEPQPIPRRPPPRSDIVPTRIIYPDPNKRMTRDEIYMYVYLSPEWQIDERTRENGLQAGKKEYFYTNLVISKQFRSLKAVEEFIRIKKFPERNLGKKKANTKKMKNDKSMGQPTVPGEKEINDRTFTDEMGPDTHGVLGPVGVGVSPEDNDLAKTTVPINQENKELPAESQKDKEIYDTVMTKVMGSNNHGQNMTNDKLRDQPTESPNDKDVNDTFNVLGSNTHGQLGICGVGFSPEDNDLVKINVVINEKIKELKKQVKMLEEKLEVEKKNNANVIAYLQSQIEKFTQNKSQLDSSNLGCN